MKTRTFVPVMILVSISFIFISGCATTSKIKEPESLDSTFLVGRITLACNNFPGDWHINGEYKSGISMHLQSFKTNEIITVRTKGKDGLLCPYDIYGAYTIIGFTFQKNVGHGTTTVRYQSIYPKVTTIREGYVNNLGDIRWIETFETITEQEYDRKGSHESGKSNKELNFIGNFGDFKEWFQNTYPDSDWNNKGWNNLY